MKRSGSALLCISLVCALTFQAFCQPVSIPNRPFAVDPVDLHVRPDGFFDVSLSRQLIGVFLLNEGTTTIKNVTAKASFDAESNIKLLDDFEKFGDLEPGIPVLGFFFADFIHSPAGKFPLTLNISGDFFNQVVSRNLFVTFFTQSEENPNAGTVLAPEGGITIEALEFFGGQNLASLTAPTAVNQTVVYLEPFAGQLGPIPYSDQWWKAVGFGVWVGATIAPDLLEVLGADVDSGTRNFAGLVATTGWTVATSDVKDPIRRGQENTVPGPNEVTIREDVDLTATYLQEPIVGTPYSANVSWTYTRTTELRLIDDKIITKTYPFSVTETVKNTHFTTGRKVSLKITEDKLVVTAQPSGGPEPLQNNNAYFVANFFLASDTRLVQILKSIVLRDDGHRGDLKAGDGIYTGVTMTTDLPHGVPINGFVFGYDLNNASESDPPEIQAQEIGGLLVSAPTFKEFNAEPDFELVVPRGK
jgi:hypothetical protein